VPTPSGLIRKSLAPREIRSGMDMFISAGPFPHFFKGRIIPDNVLKF
jgi:hypothetical protein